MFYDFERNVISDGEHAQSNKVMKVSFEFGVSPYFNERKPEFNTALKYAIFGDTVGIQCRYK